MDRNAPPGLRDTAQSAYDDSKALLEVWHGRGRAEYVITPRFSPTSTEAQLDGARRALGGTPRMPDADPSERTDRRDRLGEIALPRGARLPRHLRGASGCWARAASTATRSTSTPREIDRLAEVGAALIHCPTSNTFIGSGLFDMTLAHRLPVGLATDTGGGSSFSMLRTMAAAYEIAQLRGTALHPSRAALAGHRRLGRGAAAWTTGSARWPRDARPIWWSSTWPRPPPSPSAMTAQTRPVRGAVPDDHDGRRPRHPGRLGRGPATLTGSPGEKLPRDPGRPLV